MADTTSTTSFRADISQLKSAMQQAQRQVKLASSEFKAATAGLDNWSQSAVGLQAKLKQLNTTLDAQKKQLALMKQELEKTEKEYGKNSAAADRVRMSINNQEAAIKKTEKQIDQYNGELQKAEKYGDNFDDSLKEMNDATEKASDGFTVLKGALASLVADGIRLAINGMKDLAKQTLNAGMSFEQGMAQVEAISGATAEEMDALTEKAKEMGAKTKFSATESAEAFNYMAMAGWKTEEMINGIEGIMNLAAASGADLATTSDIVTDALTAMGYSAGDAGKLADVMAAASSNANTNVELMGATFQYAAPIVGALGYNMEDTAVQIGLMANAGIKGQKAGTALRSILTRLSAPPKECAQAMEELGISLTDSEGNMKSLDDVMQDLRKAFGKLGETEQTAAAKAIAGKEAMSGLLAIVNSAPADYEKLTKAVKDSEGASQSMADTMNDTVEGQLTLLKSQIEGIQIQIYEKLVPSLRDGIDKISETLKTVDWDKFGQKIGEITKKAIDFGIKLIDNGEGIISVIKSVGTVLAAVFVVSKISSFASAMMGLVTTFKTLKTATDVATTSQLLLNAAQAATPIGLVTAAVAGLAAGMLYLASKNNDATESVKTLTEWEELQVEKINDMRQAYLDMQEARDENVKAISSEYDYYKELAGELDGLVDANGAVKEGYEDRVNFILTTLNEAVGTEMQLVDGVIENYKEEKAAIDQLIESKKAEAILRANEELYTQAIQNKDEALQALTTAQGMYAQNMSEMTAVEKKYNDALKTTATEYMKQEGLANYDAAVEQLTQKQEALRKKLVEAKAAVGESRVAMGNAQKTYDDYMSTIQNYEGLSSAIISGDADKISTALVNMTHDFKTAETATKESLEQQLKNYQDNLKSLEQAIKNGTPNVTQDMVNQAKSMVEAAKKELDKAPASFAERANNSSKTYADTFGSAKNQEYAKSKAQLVLDATAKTLDNTTEFEAAGENNASGFGGGILKGTPSATEMASSLGLGAVNSLNNSIDAHSPSRKTTASGEYFGQGFINGMQNKESSIWQKAWNLAKTAINALKAGQKEGSPSKLTYQSGVYFVQGYINGIASQNNAVQKAVQNMVVLAFKELGKLSNYNFSTVAGNASTKFADAITKKIEYNLNRIQYAQNNKLATFDNNVKQYEKQRDKIANQLKQESANDVKALETARDAKVKALESKRDATVSRLQSQLDALSSGKENADARKNLQKQIQNEKNNATKKIKATKENYKKQIDAEKNDLKKRTEANKNEYAKLINNEKKNKEAYEKASEQMLTEYSNAMQEYQTKAQALIDDTINGITDKYNERYNELISKQDSLVNKLKTAGELFNISGAGIMTVNDLTEQTRQIKEYTQKLQQIKNKISSELFDEIASFDMKEGSAYMSRLLAMTTAELDAYNRAYTEKMQAAEDAGNLIYKSDLEKVAADYKTEINKAFNDLPSQLKELGNDIMKGFLDGLTENTDYMGQRVHYYVDAMVDVFKDALKINSPSKVMEQIGEFTGDGIVAGLKNTINDVKKAALAMADTVAVPLDDITTSVNGIRSSYGNAGNIAGQGNGTTNNYYNLVQNNTSPKALTALETYTARREQLAMVKAAAGN